MSHGPKATVMGKVCPFCGAPGPVLTLQSMDDYNRWVGGTVIQKAMPYLTPSERESLQTGICDTCWKETFSETDD